MIQGLGVMSVVKQTNRQKGREVTKMDLNIQKRRVSVWTGIYLGETYTYRQNSERHGWADTVTDG